MNFQNIHYFMSVVEEGSFSSAAKKLYVSQQSLSELIKKMESEVNTLLIERGKTIKLTVAGERFYEGCKEIMTAYQSMQEDLEKITNERLNRLTLAVSAQTMPPYLPDFLELFSERHPDISIDLVRRNHSNICHNMNYVNFYLSYVPVDPELNNYTILDDDPYYALFTQSLVLKHFGDSWPDIEKKLIETQDLSLLKNLPFIVLRDQYGKLSEDLILIFEEYDIHPRLIFKSETFGVNAAMCTKSMGVLLAPSSYAFNDRQLNNDRILAYPIKVRSFQTKLVISKGVGKRMHKTEQAFFTEYTSYVKDLFQKSN